MEQLLTIAEAAAVLGTSTRFPRRLIPPCAPAAGSAPTDEDHSRRGADMAGGAAVERPVSSHDREGLPAATGDDVDAGRRWADPSKSVPDQGS
jgi:hypothetical protein